MPWRRPRFLSIAAAGTSLSGGFGGAHGSRLLVLCSSQVVGSSPSLGAVVGGQPNLIFTLCVTVARLSVSIILLSQRAVQFAGLLTRLVIRTLSPRANAGPCCAVSTTCPRSSRSSVSTCWVRTVRDRNSSVKSSMAQSVAIYVFRFAPFVVFS